MLQISPNQVSKCWSCERNFQGRLQRLLWFFLHDPTINPPKAVHMALNDHTAYHYETQHFLLRNKQTSAHFYPVLYNIVSQEISNQILGEFSKNSQSVCRGSLLNCRLLPGLLGPYGLLGKQGICRYWCCELVHNNRSKFWQGMREY